MEKDVLYESSEKEVSLSTEEFEDLSSLNFSIESSK